MDYVNIYGVNYPLNSDGKIDMSLYKQTFMPSPVADAPTSAADAPTSAGTVPNTDVGLDNQQFFNLDWIADQAQKQMDFQTNANKIAMDFESAEADKAREFNLEMANSAMQRRVEDLKKAGLNPILAYQLGGADVPSVNGASGVTSAGAMGSMADTGYTKYQLEYAYRKMVVNSATHIAGNLLGLLK